MDTVTLYQTTYDNLTETISAKTYDVNYLKGCIHGLALFADSDPLHVAQEIKRMSEKIQAGVDVAEL